MEDYGLIATLCGALVLAFLFGVTARRFGLSPIVGYLLAGVAIGPFTPGFVGDTDLALQLAEVGVILLMFGVGLKFSLTDLWAVRRVAIPGALVQMCAATRSASASAVIMGLPIAGEPDAGLFAVGRLDRCAAARTGEPAAAEDREPAPSASAGW